MPEYQPLEPIDPREAFGATPGPEAAVTRSPLASQAALLLAARAGVLGQEDEIEELEREAAEEPNFDLPDLSALGKIASNPCEPRRHGRSGMSQAELQAESAPDVQDEMARTVNDLYQRPSISTRRPPCSRRGCRAPIPWCG